jgi:hypothetical protein
MDNFFKSNKTKLAFSIFTPLYAVGIGYLAWLSFACYLHPVNAPLMFLCYVILNILFGVAMIYTRKTLVTCVFSLFPYLFVLFMTVFAFGNWYMILPAAVTSAAAFLAAKNPEGLKMVTATFYIILTVVTIVGTMALQMLSVNLINIDDHPIIYQNRNLNYQYSPNKHYRLVEYIDNSVPEYTDTTYYVENAKKDVHLPFGTFERVEGAKWIKSIKYTGAPPDVVHWNSDNTLTVDGIVLRVG